jgi:regulator of sirC expression with transglutaminase-like and TPR domain
MDPLRSILRMEDESINLDEAALHIARIEFPDLPIAPWLAELDYHAEQIRQRNPRSFRLAAHEYLFNELCFAGNEEDYYNPHNSCLNHVLESRRGIPITLSILYIELARRLGIKVDGIGAPGHFLVRLEEEDDTYYLDVYNQGRIRETVEEEVDARFLVAAPKRMILIRMLNNLRMIYLQRQAWTKAATVLDLLLEADPVDADALRQRAATLAANHRFQAATHDLDTYLRLRPFDPDKEELQNQISRLRRMHAHKN